MPAGAEPTPSEKALALTIGGLLAAIAAPILLPAGLGALAICVVLARRGFAWHATVVAAFAAFFIVLSLLITL